jgi:hypothetical protein
MNKEQESILLSSCNINLKLNKMNKQELFEKIDGLYQEFVAQHNGTTKKSQANARKAIGEVKKLITEYRKASTEESKAK